VSAVSGERWSFALLVCGAAFLLCAGCDNNPHPRPLRETREDGSPWLVRYAGTSEDVRSLDPQYAYDQISRRVLEPVYDCLLEYHPMKTDPYELTPCLLAEMPIHEPGANGQASYLCRLKPGVNFHDDPCFPGGKGREVVAADVHFSWQRLCDPKVEATIFSNLAEYVTGFAEARAAADQNGGRFDYSRALTGLEVIDRYSFRVHLLRPYPQILYWMAMHFTCPVAREAVEYYDGKSHDGELRPDFHKLAAVGTGPFRIVEYSPRQRVRFERVPGYRTTTFPTDGFPPEKAEWLSQFAGKSLPLIDEVQMSILRENIPIFVLTRQGYLDGMGANKDAFAALLTPTKTLAPKYRDRGMFLEKDVEPSTFWTVFNMEDPVIGSNKKLRQALSSAYDNLTYSNIFMSGVAPVAEQLVPPGIFGHMSDWKNPYGYNLERARRLLAEAGYPEGRDAKTGQPLELSLEAVSSGSEDRQRAEFEQRAFAELGVRLKVNEHTFARLTEIEDRGAYQIASGSGWGADYPDPENFFFLFYSKNMPPAGKNYGRYRNPEFDRIFEQMATMENTPERLALAQQLTVILAEDCPVILNFHKAGYSVIQPWARRTHSNMMLEGGLKYVTVDHALREQKRREWNRRPVWPLAIALVLVAIGVGYAVQVRRRLNA